MKHSRVRPEEIPARMIFPDLEPDVRPAEKKPSARQLKRKFVRKNKDQERSTLKYVHATTLSFTNMHSHGELMVNFLRARKKVFIDQLQWNLQQTQGMEFDQYDTPACQWVVLHEFGEVLGGVRLLPSTARCGVYTYMLRDAQRGILKGMPTDILFFEAPVKPNIWEASRFFVTDSVSSARRLAVQQELFYQMTVAAKEGGASRILGIVPSVWARWSRRLGVHASPVGTKFSIGGTVSQSVLFNIYNQAD